MTGPASLGVWGVTVWDRYSHKDTCNLEMAQSKSPALSNQTIDTEVA